MVLVAVYVDDARNPYGRMLMCHMVADRIEELFSMADRIGLARCHFQPKSFPHFDLSLGYRQRALIAGATSVDRRGIVTVMWRYRDFLAQSEEETERLAKAAGDCGV